MVALNERLQLAQLTELCIKYGVERLGVFGSALREDFSETSDIDFVVDFGPPNDLSISVQYFGFADQLEALYGRRVDLVERKGIRNPYFKEGLEEQEVSVFAALCSFPNGNPCSAGGVCPNASQEPVLLRCGMIIEQVQQTLVDTIRAKGYKLALDE